MVNGEDLLEKERFSQLSGHLTAQGPRWFMMMNMLMMVMRDKMMNFTIIRFSRVHLTTSHPISFGSHAAYIGLPQVFSQFFFAEFYIGLPRIFYIGVLGFVPGCFSFSFSKNILNENNNASS